MQNGSMNLALITPTSVIDTVLSHRGPIVPEALNLKLHLLAKLSRWTQNGMSPHLQETIFVYSGSTGEENLLANSLAILASASA